MCDCPRQCVSAEHARQPGLAVWRTLGRGAGQAGAMLTHRRPFPFPTTRGNPGVTVKITQYLPEGSSVQ
jgi:hypothetical protein